MNAGWRVLSPVERERAYSPSSAIGGNYQPFIQAYVDRSAAARAAVPGALNLRYGSTATQRLDLFTPPASGNTPPLLVFIHGGYWQELSKNESSFAAAHCVQQGLACAVIDYTLAPHASVEQMVAECSAALMWLRVHAAELGFDADRIVLAGSSAGAHLAAMVALQAPLAVRAVVLVSGIYELEPLLGTSINDAVGLTLESAQRLSPALQALHAFPRSIVCWGEVETDEFKRQGRDFAAQLLQAGRGCSSFELPGRNHFDVILDLADIDTVLGREVVNLVRSS
jgi:arylformamidase